MKTTALDWYLQQLGKHKPFTAHEEQKKYLQLIEYRDALYAALNQEPAFIDQHFPEFRKVEADPEEKQHCWQHLQEMATSYLAYLGQRRELCALAPEYASELQAKKKNISKLYRRWGNSKKEFMEANLRLVIYVAKKYQGSTPLEERVQEGNILLGRAVDSYQPEKGKFSTYATWWIKRGVQNARAAELRIYLPAQVRRDQIAVKKAQTELEQLHGHASIRDICRKTEIPAERVEELLSISQPFSLDRIADDRSEEGHKNRSFYEKIEDKDHAAPDTILVDAQLQRRTRQIIAEYLTAQEREIVEQHFGLTEGRSARFSAARIEQLEHRILPKLRRVSEIQRLLKYKDEE